MRLRVIIFLLVPMFFLSCGDGLLVDMTRIADDPVITKVQARSFIDENIIYLDWEEDPAADEYILYKAEDEIVLSYQVIYQGTDTTFVDNDCSDENRYLYTLAKLRGQKLFGPSDPVLGVGSSVCRDELEENNSKDQATTLTWDLVANIYFYRDWLDNELEDLDWYCVTIPPRRIAYIVVTQAGQATGDVTRMMFYLEGSSPTPVYNNTAQPIPNYSYSEKIFYFLISPKSDDFLYDPTLAGGSLIGYTISLDSITSM
jgi:hypothetical protein